MEHKSFVTNLMPRISVAHITFLVMYFMVARSAVYVLISAILVLFMSIAVY